MDAWRKRYHFNQTIRTLVAGLKTEKQVIDVLKNNGIEFVNLTEEYGYLNIRIPRENGYVRIYKPYKQNELEVNSFDAVPMKYSGIPTFEPSGRRR